MYEIIWCEQNTARSSNINKVWTGQWSETELERQSEVKTWRMTGKGA